MYTTMRAVPSPNQELGPLSRSPTWVQGFSSWDHPLQQSGTSAGSWIGNNTAQIQIGTLIWDAVVTYSDLTHCATMSATVSTSKEVWDFLRSKMNAIEKLASKEVAVIAVIPWMPESQHWTMSMWIQSLHCREKKKITPQYFARISTWAGWGGDSR